MWETGRAWQRNCIVHSSLESWLWGKKKKRLWLSNLSTVNYPLLSFSYTIESMTAVVEIWRWLHFDYEAWLISWNSEPQEDSRWRREKKTCSAALQQTAWTLAFIQPNSTQQYNLRHWIHDFEAGATNIHVQRRCTRTDDLRQTTNKNRKSSALLYNAAFWKKKIKNQISQYSRRPSLFVDKISKACFFKRAIFGGDEMRENRSGRLWKGPLLSTCADL